MARTFNVQRTLGQGAHGAVLLAEVHDDDGLVQTLAVKRLHARLSADDDLAARLLDEARLLALLRHEHIVRVHGITRMEGQLAILMEPIDGVDLSRLEGEAVPPRAALQIVEAVADALDAAWHAEAPGSTGPLRVVHRDIKPSNVMITPRGGVKVMDFGVARASFDARMAETKSQQFGTARYMAPERWLEGTAGAPSDVFSLGVTMLELVAGAPLVRLRLSRQAFEEDLAEALARVAAWPRIAALAAEMCAFEPGLRPTAAEVVARIQAFVEELPAPGLRAWAPGAVAAHRVIDEPVGPTATVAVASGATQGGRPGRRGVPTWAIGVGVGALLAATGALVGWTQSGGQARRGPDPEPPRLELPSAAPAVEVGEVGEVGAPTPDPVVEPAPVEVAASVAPTPVRRPTPVTAPATTPSPDEAAVPLVPITFRLDPPTLHAETVHGPLRNNRAQQVPLAGDGTLRVVVEGGAGCTVPVAEGTWLVGRQGCRRVQ